jgi:integrase
MFTFSSKLWYNKQYIPVSGEVSLYIQVYIGSTGSRETDEIKLHIKWPVDKVDLEGSKLLPRFKSDPDVNDFNMMIMDDRGQYNEIAKNYRLARKRLTLAAFHRETGLKNVRTSLIAYMEHTRKYLLKKRLIEEQTYKNVGSTIYTIKRYQPTVRFDEIDTKWIATFKAWMRKDKDLGGEGLRVSTTWTKIKDLKHYLNMADDEVTISVDKDAIEFPNSKPEEETIFLDRDELRRLMMIYDERLLTGVQFNVLKAFLFTCFTSLRISDVYRAGKNWMVTKNMLTFTMYKGHKRKPKIVHVPLVPMAKFYIDDSLKTFFTLPSKVEYNRTLKELAAKAEIKKNLTAHVARHTYGYLFMTTVGNLFALQKVMGHSKIETTARYAHLDREYMVKKTLEIQEGFEDFQPNKPYNDSSLLL